jgi:catechol 2,3-dioxygenase-like lactoylglutathione lyase family enzyme
MNDTLFVNAYPYQKDVLSLPVENIDVAARWYSKAFGMAEVRRFEKPDSTVILARDDIQIGFAINGGDASQDGAAILVTDIHRAKSELESGGVNVGNLQVDERDGDKFHAFFVVAPDGLCFYFHQLIS